MLHLVLIGCYSSRWLTRHEIMQQSVSDPTICVDKL
jgi:hypothetical protein